MTYQSLYRRYRPRRFGEVRGQAHVVAALRNAVAEDRTSHAYLFSGPRGTGKTSTARILARALNCANLKDGEPCLECESCREIDAGRSYDLHELDAASNNGVDAMRDLIAKAALGSPGRTKVYILDEVHMLSPAAANALLKTLEEPPGHVVFILATTDPHKVLATIRSRAQHLEFHLLPAEELEEHVRWVVSDAGLEVDEEGIQHVMQLGAGSARDTLSALDQVAAAGGVIDKPGAPEALLDALVDRDTGAAIAAVAEAMSAGRDPRVLGESLLAQVRDVFLVTMEAKLDHLSDRQRDHIEALAARVSRPFVTRSLEVLGEALVDMRQAPDPRISLEVALVRLTNPASDTSIAALVDRIDLLEQALAGGDPRPAIAPTTRAADPSVAAAGSSGGSTAAADAPAAKQGMGASGRPGGSRSSGPAAAREELARHPAPPAADDDAGSGAAPAGSTSAGSKARPTLGAMRQAQSGVKSSRDPAPETSGEGSTTASSPVETDLPTTATAPPATASDAPPEPSTGGESGSGAPALDLPTRDQLTLAWADVILQKLPGPARARFSPGRFIEVADGHAVYGLPSEHQLGRCRSVQAEVERTLTAHFGRPVPLKLVVDPSATPPDTKVSSRSAPKRPTGDIDPGAGSTSPGKSESDSGSGRGRSAGSGSGAAGQAQTRGRAAGRARNAAADAPPPPEPPAGYDDYDTGPPESLENFDWDSLEDAPPAANTTGIDLLTQAFPGAELVEEPDHD